MWEKAELGRDGEEDGFLWGGAEIGFDSLKGIDKGLAVNMKKEWNTLK